MVFPRQRKLFCSPPHTHTLACWSAYINEERMLLLLFLEAMTRAQTNFYLSVEVHHGFTSAKLEWRTLLSSKLKFTDFHRGESALPGHYGHARARNGILFSINSFTFLLHIFGYPSASLPRWDSSFFTRIKRGALVRSSRRPVPKGGRTSRHNRKKHSKDQTGKTIKMLSILNYRTEVIIKRLL